MIRIASFVVLATATIAHALANPYPSDVVAWGDYQILTGPVVGAAAGESHAAALQADGTVVTWVGSSYVNRVPPNLRGVVKIVSAGDRIVAIKNDGSLSIWGDNDTALIRKFQPPADLGRVKDVALGINFVLALLEDSTMRLWGGDKNYGGVYFPKADSILKSTRHVVAISASGNDAEFVLVGDTVKNMTPSSSYLHVDLSTQRGIVALGTGLNYNIVLKRDGTVYGWGTAAGAKVPSGLSNVKAIAAGPYHALALKSDGTIAAWGTTKNNNYTSYTPMAIPPGLRNVVGIAAGSVASIAVKSDGTVVAWGDSGSAVAHPPIGVTGVRSIYARTNYPVAIKDDGSLAILSKYYYRLASKELPDSLCPARKIVGNDYSYAVLREDGTVRSFGLEYSSYQTLPQSNSNFLDLARSFYTTVAIGSDSLVKILSKSSSSCSGCELLPLGIGKVVEVDANFQVTGALKVDGSIYLWGDTSYSHLAPPADLKPTRHLQIGNRSAMALATDGTVRAWGSDTSIANVPAGLSGVKEISLHYHAMALREDGSVATWGDRQLETPADLPKVKAIAAGSGYCLAILDRTTSELRTPAPRQKSFLRPGSYPVELFDPHGHAVWSGNAVWSGTAWKTGFDHSGNWIVRARTPTGIVTGNVAIIR